MLMGLPIEILFLTSSVGALQSAFFGVYLFTLKKGRTLANILLALLLLAFAIRMIKSVSYYFSEDHSISLVLMNLGYGANLATLPLLWLYLNAFFRKDFRFEWYRDFPHLIPSVLIILLSPWLTSHFWMAQHGYTISLVVMGMYVPFCIALVVKHYRYIGSVQRFWIIGVTLGVALVWAGYTANFIFGAVPYIVAPVVFSFVIYSMSYLGLKYNNIFIPDKRYNNSVYSSGQIDTCFADLQELLRKEQLFKDPGITLPKVAAKLSVTANLLSEAINKRAAQNFPDFINRYRIHEACRRLKTKDHQHYKIATIAFETGFNSLSAFNAAFKKFTSMTPSEYRRQHTDM